MKKLLIIVILVVVIGGLYWWIKKNEVTMPSADGGNSGACTMDAMQCPDGSYVGRVAPSCEFAACPASAPGTDTSTWKTYRNESLGFEIKYPPVGLTQKIISENYYGTEIIAFEANYDDSLNTFSSFLYISVYSNTKGLNLSKWFVENFDSSDLLLPSGAYKELKLATGEFAIVNGDKPLPDTWEGGPISLSHIVMSPDGKRVFVFSPAYQDSVLIDDKPVDFFDLFMEKGFSTFRFIN